MPKALKSCPKSNKSPNLVTLVSFKTWILRIILRKNDKSISVSNDLKTTLAKLSKHCQVCFYLHWQIILEGYYKGASDRVLIHNIQLITNEVTFLKMSQLFILTKNLQKSFYFSGIRTPIVRPEGRHADNLTTTTTSLSDFCTQS